MYFDNLKFNIIAPQFIDEKWSEAEAFGGTIWLWMNSDRHKELPLHTLSVALIPAIKAKQFILAMDGSKPIFFMSWAYLSAEAETRYVTRNQLLMPIDDWQSGDRMWSIHLVAPFGHTRHILNFLKRQLMAGFYLKSLPHRKNRNNREFRKFYGVATSRPERDAWDELHPTQFHAPE